MGTLSFLQKKKKKKKKIKLESAALNPIALRMTKTL